MTSQCWARIPFSILTISTITQLAGSPVFEYLPCTMTKSPSAIIKPCSYLNEGGLALIKLNKRGVRHWSDGPIFEIPKDHAQPVPSEGVGAVDRPAASGHSQVNS